jgi:hypothetical protein
VSLPATSEEWKRFKITEACKRQETENVVSTACPECNLRFVMLAHLDAGGWSLRCVSCGWSGNGELKLRGGRKHSPHLLSNPQSQVPELSCHIPVHLTGILISEKPFRLSYIKTPDSRPFHHFPQIPGTVPVIVRLFEYQAASLLT